MQASRKSVWLQVIFHTCQVFFQILFIYVLPTVRGKIESDYRDKSILRISFWTIGVYGLLSKDKIRSKRMKLITEMNHSSGHFASIRKMQFCFQRSNAIAFKPKPSLHLLKVRSRWSKSYLQLWKHFNLKTEKNQRFQEFYIFLDQQDFLARLNMKVSLLLQR